MADDQPIILKAVTPWPLSYYWCEPFTIFQEMVEERLGGRLKIEYLGGNEVVPTFEQFEALRSGVVDVALGAASYYTGTLPEAMGIVYSRRAPAELRENGYYDLMRELHLEKGGVVYLANVGGSPGTAYRLFVNDPLETPDLSGMKIRVTPVYTELVNALGGTPVNLAPSEVYTAMESGIVDGYGWSYGGITDYAWQEVTDYVIDHPFFTANTAILFNEEVWNGLPEDIKAELEAIAVDLEIAAQQAMVEFSEGEDERLAALGLEFISFTPEDGEFFLATAYATAWDAFIAAHPEVGPSLRELSE